MIRQSPLFCRPDTIFAVDWALKPHYLSTYLCFAPTGLCLRQVVKEAVEKCLALAEGLTAGRKSIGVPALGTGTLKYPAELVAATMFQAVMEYGVQHPDTTISDVYFILYKKDDNLIKVSVCVCVCVGWLSIVHRVRV